MGREHSTFGGRCLFFPRGDASQNAKSKTHLFVLRVSLLSIPLLGSQSQKCTVTFESIGLATIPTSFPMGIAIPPPILTIYLSSNIGSNSGSLGAFSSSSVSFVAFSLPFSGDSGCLEDFSVGLGTAKGLLLSFGDSFGASLSKGLAVGLATGSCDMSFRGFVFFGNMI